MNESFNNHFNRAKKGSLAVTTSLYQARLVDCLVERLAIPGQFVRLYDKKVLPGFKAAETSSVEVFVSGDINLSTAIDQVNMPFISNFLFTCIRQHNHEFKLSWSLSLS